MHYELYPPFPGFWDMVNAWVTDVKGGQGLSGDSSQKINRRYDMHQSSFAEHGAYWNDRNVLTNLRNDLQ